MWFVYNGWAVRSFQIKAIALAINNHAHLELIFSPQYFESVHVCVPVWLLSGLIVTSGGAGLRTTVLRESRVPDLRLLTTYVTLMK